MEIIAIAVAVAIFAIVMARLLRSSEQPAVEDRRDGPADVYRQRFHEKAEQEAWSPQGASPVKIDAPSDWSASVTFGQAAHPRTEEDDAFEAAFLKAIPEDKRLSAFYTTVAGTHFQNLDGSSRCLIISKCKLGELLELEHEPENQFDPNATAVLREETKEQLGYLNARLAGELVRDYRKNNSRWLAIFRRQNHHPDTGKVVGATIYLISVMPEQKPSG